MEEQKNPKFDCEDSSEASLWVLETIFLAAALHVSRNYYSAAWAVGFCWIVDLFTLAKKHPYQGNEESAAPVFTTAIKFGNYYKTLSAVISFCF